MWVDPPQAVPTYFLALSLLSLPLAPASQHGTFIWATGLGPLETHSCLCRPGATLTICPHPVPHLSLFWDLGVFLLQWVSDSLLSAVPQDWLTLAPQSEKQRFGGSILLWKQNTVSEIQQASLFRDYFLFLLNSQAVVPHLQLWCKKGWGSYLTHKIHLHPKQLYLDWVLCVPPHHRWILLL